MPFNQNSTVYLDVMQDSWSVRGIFGSVDWGSNKPGWQFSKGDSMYKTFGLQYLATTPTRIDGTRYKIYWTSNSMIANDVEYFYAVESQDFSMTPVLFGKKIESATYSPATTGNFYEFWIKDENDELTCHVLPCYRKSDNKPGVYDIINNRFYAPTGTFELGGDV